MDTPSLLPGITSTVLPTSRLRTSVLTSGDPGGAPVVLIHGNASASRFWEETMLALPPRFAAIAPDLRGFGRTEARPIDATRGLRDFSDDLDALLSHRGVAPGDAQVHLIGWSAGAGVAMQYAIDQPARVASIVLVAPLSPFGFGGTKDTAGTPCWIDFAGSGGATANPEFVRRIALGDDGEESEFSPRRVMNKFYFKPPFRAERSREDVFVAEMLTTRVGDDHYPGDSTQSPHWPGIAPGTRGMNNALSPRYCNLAAFASIEPRPRVLWIRGADDVIVSDTSLFDFGYLGKVGAVPGAPGDHVYPPQPMVAQLRGVLDAYRALGGEAREEVLKGVGHAPHIEAQDTFLRLVLPFLDA